MELPDKRKIGRPKRRFRDLVREDMQVVGVTEKDSEERKRWKQIIHRSDP